MKGSIATILHYCTNDYRFLKKCIDEARLFSDQIVIPVCDHFFNGTKENRSLLNQSYRDHPDCTFIEFIFTPNQHYSPYSTHHPSDEGWIRLWNQISRYIGWLHLNPEIEYCFFLDSDEIAEGRRVHEWLEMKEYTQYQAIRLLASYYVLRPTLRADKLQNLVLLAKKSALEPRFFLQTDDRHGLYQHIAPPKKKEVRGGKTPLFHHYSWVRPQEECLHKADTWGHRKERNWAEEIEQAFNQKGFRDLFGNTDLLFKEIDEPYFDPLSVPIPPINENLSETFYNVKKVTPRDIFEKELSLTYPILNR